MKTNGTYRMGWAPLALALILAACNNLTGPGTDALPGAIVPEGMGTARIRLNTGEPAPSVRTAVPGMAGYYFTLDFTAPKKTGINKALDGSLGSLTLTVALEPAVWTLEVKGYANSSMDDLKVSGRASVPISAGTAANFDVYLTPDFSSGGTGTLNYSISFPSSVSRAFFALYPLDETPGTGKEIDISSSAGGSAADTLSLPEGSYRAVINLYDDAANTAAAWTGAVHISDGAATTLTRSIGAGDFAECGPVITGATLSAKLDTALGSASGSYTIVLEGTETDLDAFPPKTLNVTGENITITIRGNGKTVQLGNKGSLFTVQAGIGSSLKLVLQDLTLRGLGANTAALVRVGYRGTLEMQAGSSITGNTSTADFYTSYGGGVNVAGGTLIISGGAVNGNTATHGGGGVALSDGILSMSGGAVSGNNASSGAGMYIRGGTLSISGGSVSGNTAVYGGGVYVSSGTMNMNGGVISGNTASSFSDMPISSGGGGVYVGVGTLNMSGGVISGNIASSTSSSYAIYSGGGGVYVSVGTVNMSGGSVSYNEASGSYGGGGMYVDSGTVNMSGGAVSGNEASGSDGGGGVSVRTGTLRMSSGVVNGNKASSSSPGSSGGGGIFVTQGTFIMDDGLVSENTSAYYGGGVSVGYKGTFTLNGGAVSGNEASGFYGGGVYVSGIDAAFAMYDGIISNNEAFFLGGGVYVSGTNAGFTMHDGGVSGNTAKSGGGVYTVSGTLTMSGGAVKGNEASSLGGGVYISSGTSTMSNSTVSDNTASSGGGVFVSTGTLTMSGSTVSYNTATSDGGGVSAGGTFTMSNSTVSNNTASSGGGVFVSGGTFTMSNGTVGSNTATTGGGGVFVAGGTFTMNDGTVNGNTTLIGGGVFVDSSATFAMNGGVVSNNVFPNPYGLGLGREVAVWGGTFKMSGAARPERIFLRSNTRFITISGPLSGGTAPIDLGFDNNSPLTSWVGKPVLVLDGSYGAGNLANLKTYFTLGNAQLTIEPYTETPIPANYTIGNDGKLTN